MAGWRHLDPRIRTVWRATSLLVAALVAAALLAGLAAAAATSEGGIGLRWSTVLPVLIVTVSSIGVAWWWPGVRYRHWRYRLGEQALELSYGPVVRTESLIPYFRVQHVDTSAGPIERKLGLANLEVHTASAATDATLPGLAASDADAIRRRMLDRAGGDDAV